MPNYGHLSLSCAKIERPSPLEKFSCKVRLFAQNCFRKYRQKVAAITLSKPFLIPLFNLSHKRPTVAFTSESGYTLGFANRIAHKGTHGETGGVLGGGGITALGAFRTFTNIPGPGVRTANFAAFGPLLGLGRVYSRRTQRACGTAMRLCASLSRWAA